MLAGFSARCSTPGESPTRFSAKSHKTEAAGGVSGELLGAVRPLRHWPSRWERWCWPQPGHGGAWKSATLGLLRRITHQGASCSVHRARKTRADVLQGQGADVLGEGVGAVSRIDHPEVAQPQVLGDDVHGSGALGGVSASAAGDSWF